MHEAVTSGGRRARKAAATRDRVLDAAESLFARVGYAATTIAAIAAEADVAVQTVYAVFGNKRTILTQLLAARVVGDDDNRPLADHAEWQEMEGEPNAERQLALLAAIATRIGNRVGTLYGVLAAAATADPGIAELYQRQQQSRYHDQHRVAQVLVRNKALRAGLSDARATDIMWAVANPAMYRALVGERRWTEHEYEHWLTRTLTCALLEESG